MNLPLPTPNPVRATSRPVNPTTRRKLMFFDRIKLLVILIAWMVFSVMLKHSSVPIMPWSEAIRDQFKAKWWVLVLVAVESLRQLHYLLSERSAGYHGFWRDHVWGAWGRFWDRREPWFRYRMDRLAKRIFIALVLLFFFSWLWDTTLLDTIASAPENLIYNPFGFRGLPWFFQLLFTLGLGILQFVAIFWFMSRGGVETYMPEEIKTRFSDVWGQDRVLAQVQENIDFLERPREIEAQGGYVPAGILLWGPPGTGKTLMAEAVAGETGRPYVFVDPGAFQNMFMGVGILKVRALFKKLRKLALRHGGVIVFFDEADSLGNRGLNVAGREADVERAFLTHPTCNGLHYLDPRLAASLQPSFLGLPSSQPTPEPAARRGAIRDSVIMGGMAAGGMGTLQALLSELSGLKKPQGWLWRRVRKFLTMPAKEPPKYRILMMMATNTPQALDDALLRPGRIDRIYKVDYPSLEGRIQTFDGYLAKVKNDITADQVRKLAIMMPFGTGARIKDIVNESLIVALRRGRDTVTWPDILEAKHIKNHGIPDPVHSEALERHSVAIHEACHAVAGKLLRRRMQVDVATIEPRGSVGGFVSSVYTEEPGFAWRTSMEEHVMVSLASLAGERIFYEHDNSVGVGGDMRAATDMVYSMLGFAAMGDRLSSMSVYRNAFGLPGGETARNVEIKLKELYDRTHAMLMANRRWVMAIAHALEEHKTITGEDIDAIFNGTRGPIVDGRWYHTDDFVEAYIRWHQAALDAHRNQSKLLAPFPQPNLASLPSSAAPIDLPARPPTA